MITKILKKTASATTKLEYNEPKVDIQKAAVVAVNLIVSPSHEDIYSAILMRESNPRIAPQFKLKGFEMTVNPSPDDYGLYFVDPETGKAGINEPIIIRYISDVMERLGYGDQPYVVYRHFDIDRVHYHIVSTRVDWRGRKIRDTYEHRRVEQIQRELAPKYGYFIGNEGKEVKVSSADPEVVKNRRFDPKAQKTMANMTALLEEGLKFDFTSFEQFQAVMQAMSLKVTMTPRNNGGYNVIARGIADIKDYERTKKAFVKKNGLACGMDSADPFEYMFTNSTRPYSYERDMHYPAYARISERMEFNKRNRILLYDSKVALIAVSDWIMKHTTSEDMYCRCLDQLDISHTVIRGEDETIRRVILVNRRKFAIADTAPEGGLFLPAFTGSEKSKVWDPQKKYRGLRKSRELLENKPEMSEADLLDLKDYVNNEIRKFHGDDPRRNRHYGKSAADIYDQMIEAKRNYRGHGYGPSITKNKW